MTTIGGEYQAAASVQQTERCLHAAVEAAEQPPPPRLHDTAAR